MENIFVNRGLQKDLIISWIENTGALGMSCGSSSIVSNFSGHSQSHTSMGILSRWQHDALSEKRNKISERCEWGFKPP